MLRLLALLALAATLTVAPASASAAVPGDAEALKILERGMADPGNATLLGQLLGEVDREVASHPDAPSAHYARGWLLSHLGRGEEAVKAYDRASALDPKLADALYNCGVVLSDLGRHDEALARWDAATKVDPRMIDAYYNAAQTYYNRRQFKEALERWEQAAALDPGDFGVAKKVLQALNALGDKPRAAKAREALIALWKSAEDERVRGLSEFCFDQRDVGKAHVYIYETFEPKGDLYYVYTVRVAGPQNKLAGAVMLESSAVIRELGTPYVLGFNRNEQHHTTDRAYKELPSWDLLWPEMEKIIRAEFADVVE
ncbi:MAG: tetratricopeptide repeat protein [Deltaproteobacteria bacterium]|nr:MAG: tetratricopeptide repeat protein [Deltaproteobacteria bacterium]